MLSNRFRTIKVYPKDLPSGPRHAETPSVAAALPSSSKSVLGPESLLATLPTELSHSLFARARPVSLAAAQTLFVAGDEGNGCYRVEEGLLKASIAAPAGGERILAVLGPGSVVGELAMIDGAPRSASVTALRDSKLSFVGRAAFEAFGRSRPELYRHVATLLARRLRDTDDALVATNFLSVKARVARALLSLAEAFGRDIGQGRILVRQKVSQSDLAAMAGIARENVSRVLHDWSSRSLVSRLAGYYCLENTTVLKREADE
jgi:CRP/FNR family transcriptional regulator, cyclic AMP receptor protein